MTRAGSSRQADVRVEERLQQFMERLQQLEEQVQSVDGCCKKALADTTALRLRVDHEVNKGPFPFELCVHHTANSVPDVKAAMQKYGGCERDHVVVEQVFVNRSNRGSRDPNASPGSGGDYAAAASEGRATYRVRFCHEGAYNRALRSGRELGRSWRFRRMHVEHWLTLAQRERKEGQQVLRRQLQRAWHRTRWQVDVLQVQLADQQTWVPATEEHSTPAGAAGLFKFAGPPPHERQRGQQQQQQRGEAPAEGGQQQQQAGGPAPGEQEQLEEGEVPAEGADRQPQGDGVAVQQQQQQQAAADDSSRAGGGTALLQRQQGAEVGAGGSSSRLALEPAAAAEGDAAAAEGSGAQRRQKPQQQEQQREQGGAAAATPVRAVPRGVKVSEPRVAGRPPRSSPPKAAAAAPAAATSTPGPSQKRLRAVRKSRGASGGNSCSSSSGGDGGGGAGSTDNAAPPPRAASESPQQVPKRLCLDDGGVSPMEVVSGA
jgi:hypothetical protein